MKKIYVKASNLNGISRNKDIFVSTSVKYGYTMYLASRVVFTLQFNVNSLFTFVVLKHLFVIICCYYFCNAFLFHAHGRLCVTIKFVMPLHLISNAYISRVLYDYFVFFVKWIIYFSLL